MRAPGLSLFTGSPVKGSSPSWHRGQYFGLLPHATQTSIHPLNTSEVSEGQKQRAGGGDFPAFLNEDLTLQE